MTNREKYAALYQEFSENVGGTLRHEEEELALQLMELSRLDRIAEALEGIQRGIEMLSDSTTKNPNGTRDIIVRVSGEVGTY